METGCNKTGLQEQDQFNNHKSKGMATFKDCWKGTVHIQESQLMSNLIRCKTKDIVVIWRWGKTLHYLIVDVTDE